MDTFWSQIENSGHRRLGLGFLEQPLSLRAAVCRRHDHVDTGLFPAPQKSKAVVGPRGPEQGKHDLAMQCGFTTEAVACGYMFSCVHPILEPVKWTW